MLLQRDVARLLGSIAFQGMWEGRFAEGESIFRALRSDAPDRVGAPLGLALALIHQGKADQATVLLEQEVLPLDPSDPHTQCWLGLALYMKGEHSRAAALLTTVVQGEHAPDAIALATSLLDDMGKSAE